MFILALYDHEFNMKTLVLIILLPGRKGVSSTTGFLKKKMVMKLSQFYSDPSIKCKKDWLLPQSYHSYF